MTGISGCSILLMFTNLSTLTKCCKFHRIYNDSLNGITRGVLRTEYLCQEFALFEFHRFQNFELCAMNRQRHDVTHTNKD
jgi:hypothetical protein